MEIKDLRDFILTSPAKDWYENAEYSFPFQCSKGTIKKKGFLSIFEFVEKQIRGFNSLGKEVPSVLNWSKTYFSEIKKELDQYIRTNHASKSHLTHSWQSFGSRHKRDIANLISFDSPETQFLVELQKSVPSLVQGAFLYFTGQKIPNDKLEFAGALKAYEFSMDGGAKISRPAAEKAALTKLSKEIEAALDFLDRHFTTFDFWDHDYENRGLQAYVKRKIYLQEFKDEGILKFMEDHNNPKHLYETILDSQSEINYLLKVQNNFMIWPDYPMYQSFVKKFERVPEDLNEFRSQMTQEVLGQMGFIIEVMKFVAENGTGNVFDTHHWPNRRYKRSEIYICGKPCDVNIYQFPVGSLEELFVKNS